MTAPAVIQWAFDRGAPVDLDRMAEDLRTLILEPDRAAPPPAAAEQPALSGPNLGETGGGDHLPDALCLLLQRYLSPAREGDPALLGELLRLTDELRPVGGSEVITGLLLGGAYRGIVGPHGPLERQMVQVLLRSGLDDAERGLLQLLLEGLPEDSPEPVAPEPTEEHDPSILRGDQVPQVNDPDQVFAFIDAVGRGIDSRREFAHHARVSVRQADFIARAAASLGLVEIAAGGHYTLTAAGASLPGAEDTAGRESRHRFVGGHPLMRALDLGHVGDNLPQIQEIEDLLLTRTALGPGTVCRRAQALLRWVQWWASGGR